MKRIVILGAGGQAREVRWILEDLNRVSATYHFLGYVVSDLSKLGERDSRSEVLGDYGWLREHRGEIDALTLGIGSPQGRLKVAGDLEPEFGSVYWPALIHPSAVFDPKSCRFAHGALVCPGVVATVNIEFQPHAMANFGCTIGHESSLGRGCVVMPGANISGGVVLEEGCMVGTGAQVLQYRRVGRAASVGAGAVVTKDVPPGETVVGIPAKPLKK
ncbi:MAG: hypothetical protein HY901_10990 [Deltaproteobacteria bacterium]|nr:hypothetical protein [Deltaproteobacteria bacterium]